MPSFKELLQNLLKVSIPITFAYLCNSLINLSNLAFLAQAGGSSQMIAGLGLAIMFVAMSSNAVIIGMNSSLATLVPQCRGQGNLKLCGLYLNQARIVSFFSQMLITCLLLHCEQLLKLCNFDPEAARYAQITLNYQMIGLFFFGQYDCIRAYSNFFQKSYLTLIVTTITSILHMVWSYLFIVYWDMKVEGAGISITITHFSNLLLMYIIISLQKDMKEAWFGPNLECFKGLGDFIKLALACGSLIFLEIWAFQLLTFMSGFLTLDETVAQIILVNVLKTLFVFALGLNLAASSLVGHSIGSGNIPLAKQYQKLAQVYGIVQSLVLFTFIIGTRNQIARIFSQDEEVQKVFTNILVSIGWVLSFLEQMQNIQVGIIKGIAKAPAASKKAIISYYLISIPSAFVFAFPLKFGIFGLLFGMSLGLLTICIFYQYMISFQYDWNVFFVEAKKRSEKDINRQNKILHDNVKNDEKKENLL